MSSKFKVQSLKLFCLFVSVFFVDSCGLSIPNLEQTECSQARIRVKEFYSFHFGNDMKPSDENLRARERFLTEDLTGQMRQQALENQDYFTQTDDYPKAFSVGKCEVVSPEKTVFNVLLFWRDDTRTEQREIKVEAVKQNDIWLINKVETE
jgi:hypothetical protein